MSPRLVKTRAASGPEAAPLPRKTAAFGAILWGGFASGVMDITAALAIYGSFGLKPLRLLQGIAGGLLGPRTYEGGLATAFLGLLCHFCIAFGAAAVYFVYSQKLPFLVRRPLAAGALYGAFVYFFMNRIIVPLSRATQYPFSLKMVIIGLAIHICCVGLPISLARRYAKPASAP